MLHIDEIEKRMDEYIEIIRKQPEKWGSTEIMGFILYVDENKITYAQWKQLKTFSPFPRE